MRSTARWHVKYLTFHNLQIELFALYHFQFKVPYLFHWCWRFRSDQIVLFISQSVYYWALLIKQNNYNLFLWFEYKKHRHHFNFSFANIKYAYVGFIDQFCSLFCVWLGCLSTLHLPKKGFNSHGIWLFDYCK